MSNAGSRDNTRFDTCPERVRPYAAFVDQDGRTWLPWADVEKNYPKQTERLEHWHRRGRGPIPAVKVPEREEFVVWDPRGGRIVKHWFWVKEQLDENEKALTALAKPQDDKPTNDEGADKGLTDDEARQEIGISRSRYYELLKLQNDRGEYLVRRWRENREVERKRRDGSTHLVLVSKRVASRDDLRRELARLYPAADHRLITPEEFSNTTNVPIPTLIFWEGPSPDNKDQPHGRCPELNRYLVVERADINRVDVRDGRRVNFHLSNAKHYLRKDRDDYLSAIRKRDAQGGRGVHVDQSGEEWRTLSAAEREDKKYSSVVLKYLAEERLIKTLELTRHGFGRRRKRPNAIYFKKSGEDGYVANYHKAPPLETLLAERGHKRAAEREKLRLAAMKPAALVTEEPRRPNPQATVNLTKVERALIILRRDPQKSNRAIAAEVGCNASLLSNDPEFKKVREFYKEACKANIPKGTKNANRTVEAEQDDEFENED
jgi:hypothetical protein